MNRAFKLFRLQQVDTQLDQIQNRLAEIEKILAEDQTIKEATQVNHQAVEDLAAAQRELRYSEEEVKTQQQHIEQNQATLYSGKVTNPKELQDLQKEAEALTRHLRGLEDAELEKMAAFEERQSWLKKTEDNLEGLKAQQGIEQQALHSEQSQLLSEFARLTEEQESALSGISPEDLELYHTVRKTKGLAVAKVQNKTCSACGAELSASLAQAARAPDELVRCDNCKRFLYAG